LVQRLTDKVVGETKDDDQILLDEAITTWSMQDMKDDEMYVETNTEQNEGNVTKGGNSTEVEKRKGKCEGGEVEKEDKLENRMDIGGEEKEETEEKEIVP